MLEFMPTNIYVVNYSNIPAPRAIPAKAERYEDEGFTYHSDLGISIQGQSAVDAWRETDRLANKWRIPVTVEFWWRQNPKAQYPGRTGMLRSGQ